MIQQNMKNSPAKERNEEGGGAQQHMMLVKRQR
jgi:hypothetical protein